MNPGPQIEILDLRHFTSRQLRPVLEAEAAFWYARLRWDYSASAELLLGYLDSAMLPGFVALLRGRPVGYCFAVYEGSKAVLGDVFVLESTPGRMAVTHTLLRHLLEVLTASPGIARIESQLLLFDPGGLSPVFEEAGFTLYRRLFLELALDATKRRTDREELFSDFEILPWTATLYDPTAALIHACYLGHVDARINDQYCSLHGSLRFLHNIVRFPGCGTFDPAASMLLRHRDDGTLVAAILCSRVAAGTAHVTQLCVLPGYRGHALGAALLERCMDRLAKLGYAALTLTVSEANGPALALYRSAGFTVRLHFEAVVKELNLVRLEPLASPGTVEAGQTRVPAAASLFSAFTRKKT